MSAEWLRDWRQSALCPSSGISARDWTANRRPRATVRVRMEAVCRGCPVRGECAADALVCGMDSAMAAGVWIPLDIGQNEHITVDVRRQLTVIAGEWLPIFQEAAGVVECRDEVSAPELILVHSDSTSRVPSAQWDCHGDERLGAAV